jgi:type I restriction enzyme S subunit
METEILEQKEIKRVPNLRFEEFEAKWFNTKLGEFLTFKNGLNSEKEKYGSGIKFINVLDIINNDFITYERIIGSVEVTQKELEKNNVSFGDILFQRSSETREDVGQSNVYLDKHKSAVFGGFVIRGKGLKDYNPLFINYLLKTGSARNEITSKSGGSTRYNVGQETLANVVITTTSLSEQQKIASFLSAVDKKIQQLTRKKELLDTYKKGVMQQLFSQEIRFKTAGGKDFPEWERKKLKDICTFFSGGTPVSTNKAYYSGSIPFIGSGNIYDSKVYNFITKEALKSSSSKMINRGDLLYALYGANSGECAISKMNGAINQAILCIRSKYNIQYFYFLLSFNKGKIIGKYLQGGQGNLSTDIIKKLKFQFPALQEQQKISEFLSAVDRKIETVQQQITKTQSFKKGLLQQMFV